MEMRFSMKFAASGRSNRTTDSPIPNHPGINRASTFRKEQVHLKLDVLALGWGSRGRNCRVKPYLGMVTDESGALPPKSCHHPRAELR